MVAHNMSDRKSVERALLETQKELEHRVVELGLDESRLEALLQLSRMTEASLKEITDFALEQAVALTKSTIGYLSFMNQDETVLMMHSWSKEAMAECAMSEKPLEYPVATTGLWGEAVRQRKPIVTNDYAAPNPWKKGLPEGHVALRRHMNVPIFDGGRIVVVAGVGNKDENYNESDVRQLTLLMEGMWMLLQRHRMQAELRQHRDHLEQLVNERTKALGESEAKYRHLIETTDTGFLILDEDGCVVDANEEYIRISGHCDLNAILGHSVLEWTAPCDLERSAKEINDCLQTGRIRQLVVDYVRDDGTMAPTEINASVINTAQGKRILSLCRDISDRKQAEAALKQSHDELQSLYNSMDDGVLVADVETKDFIRANAAICEMLGYSRDELLGKSIKDIHPPESVSRVLEAFTALVEGRLTIAEDIPMLRKDGSVFYADITRSTLDYGGRPVAAGSFRDITERKNAQEALQREHRTLKHLLQSSDHERQTIAYDIHDGLAQHLAAAMMHFQMYDHLKNTNPEEAAKAHAAGVVMLRQSHCETRRLISNVRPPILDESGVVAAIAHLVDDQRFEGGPEIEFRSKVTFRRLAPALENAIYRIVQEAVTNACKHSHTEKVRVSLSQHGEYLRIEVRDWGVSFAPDAVEEGRYGLEGIRQRARLLGGTITIDSAAGRGTRIVVKLPICEQQESH